MVSPIINMPNYEKHNGISGIPTQLLVLHSAECPLRGGYAQSLTNWANTPLSQGGPVASWQRFVDPIARVRMVPDQYAAWHASEANPMSIGWEQAGYAAFTQAQWETPEGLKQLDNLAYDMAEVAKRDGIPPVWLTTTQVEAVTKHGNRTIKGFCIHAQIDPETRTDPGASYPYDRLMNRIKYHLAALGTPSITPQSTPTPKEPGLSQHEVKQIKDHINALVIHGYTSGGKKYAGLAPILTVNQREQRETNAIVTNLVAALNRVTAGEPFDEAKLLAGVRAAAAAGTAEAITSIETTVNLKGTL